MNVYAYALNDPVGGFDPYGLNNFGGPIFQSSNPNAPLYRPPVPSLFDIKDDATSFAEGLPGRSSAERDAVRHCVASCEATSAYGRAVAAAAGTANELQRSARGGQTTGDRKMDDFNNEAGRDLAQDALDCGNKPDCKKACVDALNSGLLDTSNRGTGQQYSPGGYTR